MLAQVAGNETTAGAIAEGVLLLIKHPEQLALLRRDPGRVANFVEEVLRLSPPTANMWRVCKADTGVNGTRIPAGSLRFAVRQTRNNGPTWIKSSDPPAL